MKFYVDENNSGGYTVALGVLGDEERFHWVEIEAGSVDEAIHKFEAHFGVDWNEQNSYEGGSCNCCGRRFCIYAPVGHTHSDYDEHDQVYDYAEGTVPYFAAPSNDGGSKKPGGKLEDAPVVSGRR